MGSNGFEPRVLICCECGEEFVFTSEAQQYFAERGYTEDPRRCKFCHTRYKKMQREQNNPKSQHQKQNNHNNHLDTYQAARKYSE